ncbi:MAG: hypothetical protein BMS9Abin29_0110 [Gemmatimonadota bacterium]|nr:MAG: hypothetical protein BMS9Abin29_0110 [Gemmatimonadota bacterium]
MKAPTDLPIDPVPVRALLLSLGALGIPVVGALAIPDTLGEYGALLWLLALIPAFLLAYYRGWRGAATALAFGMATLSVTQVVAVALRLSIPDTLIGVVIAFVGGCLGIGWLAELLHQQRQEAQALAYTDNLTHLPNRRRVQIVLENEFAAAMRGRPLAVVLFDLDNFKEYNDHYGHAAGDEALRIFGGVLLETTRQMNISGRFGGEEFLSVLAESSSDGAMVFAERVRASLRAAGLGRGPLTVSAGVAGYHTGIKTPDELLAGADHALYRSKREGRDCVRLFGKTSTGTEQEGATVRHPAPPGSAGFARRAADLGKGRPPITLLPHHITQFGGGRRLLLVGDDARLRALVATYLNREGFEVTEVADIEDASHQLEQEYDVAVVDFHASTGPAPDLIRSMKSRWPITQVLALTGTSDARVGAQAQAAGADRHLFQPFTMPELRAHLVDALARRDRLSTAAEGSPDISATEKGPADLGRDKVIQGVRYLVEGAEARDSFKIGRSTYVAAYAVELARVLDPAGELLDHDSLHLGSEVHDVGMIAVPWDVLNKPGTLTESEWEEIREHPKTGHDLLAPVLSDPAALAIVKCHHERWDGSGYPDGLAGTAIPLGARIVAVADALEALTSKRAFREAWDWPAAVEEILNGMGSRFDPDILQAFEEVVPSLKTIGGETRSGSV